jgi:hypothetical protein
MAQRLWQLRSVPKMLKRRERQRVTQASWSGGKDVADTKTLRGTPGCHEEVLEMTKSPPVYEKATRVGPHPLAITP